MTEYKRISDIRVSKTKNVTYRAHIHSRYEAVVVLDGVLRMQIGEKIYDIQKGYAVFAEEYEPHSFISGKENVCCIIEFPPEVNPSFSAFLKENSAEDRIVKLSDEVCDFIINRFLEKRTEATPKNRVTLHTAVALLCEEFVQKCNFVHKKTEKDDVFFSALEIITRELKSPISLSGVAQRVGVSPEHLSRKFSQKANMGFSEYVRYLRVCDSIGILVRGGSVTEAAFESGFEDIRTFNRAFKSVIGLSPSQYRKSGYDNSVYY